MADDIEETTLQALQRHYVRLSAWMVRGNRIVEPARPPEPPARIERPNRFAVRQDKPFRRGRGEGIGTKTRAGLHRGHPDRAGQRRAGDHPVNQRVRAHVPVRTGGAPIE